MFVRAARVLRRAILPKPGRKLAYPESFSPAMDLPRFEGSPRLYLIASTPRSGSHFLGHALSRTGHFGAPLEYLNAGSRHGWRDRFGTEEMASILRELVACRTSVSGWFGVKAHWSQFQPYADMALFAHYGGIERTIFIQRRDLLAQAISYMRAAQTGQFISGATRQGELRYDYGRVVARARNIRTQNEAWAAFFRDRFAGPVRRVVYEDLVADGFGDVAAFVDPGFAGEVAASERMRKQSDGLSAEWRERTLKDLRDEDRWLLKPQAW